LIKPAASEARAAKAREQQTRTVAVVLYSAGSKIVWGVALLTAASEFRIDVLPAATLAGLASLALGFGAQNLVRDVITGLYIILEDQFVVGDTIRWATRSDASKHLTLRRTVVRDARGALVTLSNGEIRTVANLSRDWSQAFVDVALSPSSPRKKLCRRWKPQPPSCAAMHPGRKRLWTARASWACRILTRTLPRCDSKSAPHRPAKTM